MANIKLTTTCVISMDNFLKDPKRNYALSRLIMQMEETGAVSNASIRRIMYNALLDVTMRKQECKVYKGKIITGLSYKAELMREKHAA